MGTRRTKCSAAAYLSQATLPGTWDYPARPRAGRRQDPVRAPYYRWLAHPVTDPELVQAHRANALFDAPHDRLKCACRFLAEEAREAGPVMAERTGVGDLCP